MDPVVEFYNLTWMMYSLVVVCALLRGVVFNHRASDAAKENAYGWIATELNVFLRVGFWQLGLWTAVRYAPDGSLLPNPQKFATWAFNFDWLLVFPTVLAVFASAWFVLRRMTDELWFIVGLSTMPVAIVIVVWRMHSLGMPLG